MNNNYEVFMRLRKYYERHCAPLIFYGEQRLENNDFCKMYFLDTTTEKELKNYKKVFQEYLFLYVRNYDTLFNFDNLREERDEDRISDALYINGKKTWYDESLIITSNPITLGIYGELFDEFYLNVVKKENILLTYSTKNSFNTRNIKGVFCWIYRELIKVVESYPSFTHQIDGLYKFNIGYSEDFSLKSFLMCQRILVHLQDLFWTYEYRFLVFQ